MLGSSSAAAAAAAAAATAAGMEQEFWVWKWRKASNHQKFKKKKCIESKTSISFLIIIPTSIGQGFSTLDSCSPEAVIHGLYGVVVDNLCIFGWREPIFNLHDRLVFQCLGSTQGTWDFRKWDRGISEDVGGMTNGKIQIYPISWVGDPKKGDSLLPLKPLSLDLKGNLSGYGSPTF